MNENIIDVTIVGGGVLGLSIAWGLSRKYKNSNILLVDKEVNLGEHATGRNSGVLHSGIYYKKNGLKRYHSMRGNLLWRQFCSSRNIPLIDTGKYIISSNKEVLPKMNEIFQKGKENDVQGIRIADKKEVEKISQYCHILQAIYVPSACVFDVSECMRILSNEYYNNGGILFKNTEVINVIYQDKAKEFLLESTRETFSTKYLINCAGFNAVTIRKMLGLVDLEDYYVKGHYLKYKKNINTPYLLYPVPDNSLGLGVHLTLDTDLKVKFGPNTVNVKKIEYGHEDFEFKSMFNSIKRLFKGINESDLYWDYCGIRPKIMHNKNIVDDFIININPANIIGYSELLGIESPGLTSALSISEYICSKINL